MSAPPVRLKTRAGLVARRSWTRLRDTLTGTGRRFATRQLPASTPPGTSGFGELLAEFSAPIINPAYQRHVYENKMSNLGLVRSAVDRLVLEPGQVFSFWQRVGPTDERRGYKEASVFIGNALHYTVGGGICQASGVIYNAAILAGMRVLERHPHRVDIYGDARYIPLGRDATVVWGRKDLRFANPFGVPVLLSLEIQPDLATARMFAPSRPFTRVEIAIEEGEVIPATEQIRPDATLIPGETAVDHAGATGRTTTTWRTLTGLDGRSVRERLSTDRYQMLPRILRRGLAVVGCLILLGVCASGARAGEETDWFWTRFGAGTWIREAEIHPDSFSIIEYEDLISRVERGRDDRAAAALAASIYPEIRQHPDGRLARRFRDRLYDPVLLAHGVWTQYGYGSSVEIWKARSSLPDAWFTVGHARKLFSVLGRLPVELYRSLPSGLARDRRLLLGLPESFLDQPLFRSLPDTLRNDPAILARFLKTHPWGLQWTARATQELKAYRCYPAFWVERTESARKPARSLEPADGDGEGVESRAARRQRDGDGWLTARFERDDATGTIVTAGDDGFVEAWAVKDGRRRSLALVRREGLRPTALEITPGAGFVLVGDAAGGIVKYDLRHSGEPALIRKGGAPVTALCSLPGKGLVLAGSADGALECWDSRTAALTWSVSVPGAVQRFHLLPDGAQVLLAFQPGNGVARALLGVLTPATRGVSLLTDSNIRESVGSSGAEDLISERDRVAQILTVGNGEALVSYCGTREDEMGYGQVWGISWLERRDLRSGAAAWRASLIEVAGACPMLLSADGTLILHARSSGWRGEPELAATDAVTGRTIYEFHLTSGQPVGLASTDRPDEYVVAYTDGRSEMVHLHLPPAGARALPPAPQ